MILAPKYRRLAIYGKIKVDIGKILRKSCKQKGVEIIEANACKDHIHMLVSIPLKLSVAICISISPLMSSSGRLHHQPASISPLQVEAPKK